MIWKLVNWSEKSTKQLLYDGHLAILSKANSQHEKYILKVTIETTEKDVVQVFLLTNLNIFQTFFSWAML